MLRRETIVQILSLLSLLAGVSALFYAKYRIFLAAIAIFGSLFYVLDDISSRFSSIESSLISLGEKLKRQQELADVKVDVRSLQREVFRK